MARCAFLLTLPALAAGAESECTPLPDGIEVKGTDIVPLEDWKEMAELLGLDGLKLGGKHVEHKTMTGDHCKGLCGKVMGCLGWNFEADKGKCKLKQSGGGGGPLMIAQKDNRNGGFCPLPTMTCTTHKDHEPKAKAIKVDESFKMIVGLAGMTGKVGGGDISHADMTEAGCQELCAKVPGCTGFSFEGSHGKCGLVTGDIELKPKGGKNTHVCVQCRRLPPGFEIKGTDLDPQDDWISMIGVPGAKLGGKGVEHQSVSVDDCQNLCLSVNDCANWVLHTDTGRCHLKKNIKMAEGHGGVVPKANVESAFCRPVKKVIVPELVLNRRCSIRRIKYPAGGVITGAEIPADETWADWLLAEDTTVARVTVDPAEPTILAFQMTPSSLTVPVSASCLFICRWLPHCQTFSVISLDLVTGKWICKFFTDVATIPKAARDSELAGISESDSFFGHCPVEDCNAIPDMEFEGPYLEPEFTWLPSAPEGTDSSVDAANKAIVFPASVRGEAGVEGCKKLCEDVKTCDEYIYNNGPGSCKLKAQPEQCGSARIRAMGSTSGKCYKVTEKVVCRRMWGVAWEGFDEPIPVTEDMSIGAGIGGAHVEMPQPWPGNVHDCEKICTRTKRCTGTRYHEAHCHLTKRVLGFYNRWPAVNSQCDRPSGITCPSSMPWSYNDGDGCCGGDHEADDPKQVEGQDPRGCDGGALSGWSKCCKGASSKCPIPPCLNFPGTEWLDMGEPTPRPMHPDRLCERMYEAKEAKGTDIDPAELLVSVPEGSTKGGGHVEPQKHLQSEQMCMGACSAVTPGVYHAKDGGPLWDGRGGLTYSFHGPHCHCRVNVTSFADHNKAGQIPAYSGWCGPPFEGWGEAKTVVIEKRIETVINLGGGEATDPLPIALGAGAGAIVLVIAGSAYAWHSTKKMREMRKKFDTSNLAVDLAEKVARMDLEALEYLNEVQNPNKIQLAFITIVKTLKQYREFMPASVLANLDQAASEASSQKAQQKKRHTKGSVGSKNQGTHDSASGSQSTQSLAAPTMMKAANTGNSLMQMGVREKMVTVAVVNVRNFHGLFLGDGKNLVANHSLFAALVIKEVRSSRGMSEQFSGDRMVMHWNTVTAMSTHRGQACSTMLAITTAVTAEIPKLSHGVVTGIAASKSQCGNIGCQGMKKYAVIGPAFPMAAMLCSMTKAMNECKSLMTDAVSIEVAGNFYVAARARCIYEKALLKGKGGVAHRPQTISELISAKKASEDEWMYQLEEGAKSDPYNALNAAVDAWVKGDAEAAKAGIAGLAGEGLKKGQWFVDLMENPPAPMEYGTNINISSCF